MALKEDYKDATFSGLRKYKKVDNGDGTVSMVDVTEYAEAGDKFGAKDVNAMTKMINNTGDDFNEEQDYVAGDYAVHDNKVWKFTSPHPAGPWDESHVEPSNILKELAEQNKNFAELTEKSSYLTDETICGTWIDGRSIYRRVIYVPDLTLIAGQSTRELAVAIDLSMVDNIVSLYGTACSADNSNTMIQFPFYNPQAPFVSYLYVYDKNAIRYGSTRSLVDIYIIIEYVKLS